MSETWKPATREALRVGVRVRVSKVRECHQVPVGTVGSVAVDTAGVDSVLVWVDAQRTGPGLGIAGQVGLVFYPAELEVPG